MYYISCIFIVDLTYQLKLSRYLIQFLYKEKTSNSVRIKLSINVGVFWQFDPGDTL